jgi:serine/threonine protein kinase/tetratricopeptide (TPR) repeat protein
MTPERWQQIDQLLDAALQRNPDERSPFLAEACAGDESLRREVESLLAAHNQAATFIEASPPGAAEIITDHQAKAMIGRTLGHYQIRALLGAGGMGEVWLAEQKEPVRRRVALKVVKAGMNTREVITRFESERQALALMDHPAIAKVFDAGSTPQGAPYFVMEYIAGVPITAYCDRHRLSTRARLELFMHVCDGVQHAHQKAVIHRDLKPSNILVTEVDGRVAPKIIDFGVAKALTQRLTAVTMFTRLGALVGTPEYMSPEQALSSGEDIDTRTDVYSLGIILYELMAGVPPIELRKIAFEEFLRRLREQEPPKPSTKIRTQEPTTVSELARNRQREPRALVKELRGDLDSIALKAIEKDRLRRYSSPSDLAADIGRYLNNQAVLAVPPSARYRARKFARRYRAALVTTAAFMLVLILAAGVSIRQSIRANREAAVAQKEAAAAQAVNNFLQNDLLAQASAATQSGASAKPDPDLKVRTTLDRAAARITGRFEQQPEVEAAIRDTIGQTYLDLGVYPEARTQLERALDLHRRVLGTEDAKTLKTTTRLGRIAFLQGNYAEAEALLGQTLEIQHRVLGSSHSDTLTSMNNLAVVYQNEGKHAQAEALLGQTVEIQRRVLGSDHPDTLSSMNGLANVYEVEGKYVQAEALNGQTLEIRRRVLGPEHPETLSSMNNLANNLANAHEDQRKYAEAEALHRQTLEIRRRVLGPEHPNTMSSMANLAFVYLKEGKYAEAEALNHQTLEISRRALGPEHPITLVIMSNLALAYWGQGKYAPAEALYGQTLEMDHRILGPEHPEALNSMSNMANVYQAEGNDTRAEVLFSQTLQIQRRVLGPEHPGTLETLSRVAFLYQRQGKYELAETHAAEALAGRRHTLGPENMDTMASAADLALAYLSQGKFTETESLAREAVEFNRKKQPDHWQRFRAEGLVGASLAGQKKYAEAEQLLLDSYRGMLARKDRIAVPDWYHLKRAREWIVQLYQEWGKPKEAAEWRKK